jgi:hypothetical protein
VRRNSGFPVNPDILILHHAMTADIGRMADISSVTDQIR